jgi:hypothetical protein
MARRSPARISRLTILQTSVVGVSVGLATILGLATWSFRAATEGGSAPMSAVVVVLSGLVAGSAVALLSLRFLAPPRRPE